MNRSLVAGCLTVLTVSGAAAGSAWADTIVGVTEANRLVTFDADHPGTIISSLPITGLTAGETIVGIDVRPSTRALYAVTGAGSLLSLDPNTGAATLVAALAADPTDLTSPFTGLSGTNFGVDFNPVSDRLRIVSDTGQSLRVNPASGFVTTDTSLSYDVMDPNVGQVPAIVDAAYTNNFPGATTTTLYELESALYCQKTFPEGDPSTAPCLVRQGSIDGTPVSPNLGLLFTMANFGRDGVTLRGFDVAANGRAYAAVFIRTTPVVTAVLVEIDLAEGKEVGSLGYIGDGEVPIVDIAVIPSLRFDAALHAAREGGPTVTLTVTRTEGTAGAMTVDYTTVSGSAVAESDYATARGRLTFADGVASQQVEVAIHDDPIVEGDETFQVVLTNPAGGATLGFPSAATVRISPSDIVDRTGPTVTRFGLTGPSRGITGAVVHFSEDMDPATATDLANFSLTGLRRTGGKVPLTFSAAVYDPALRITRLTATAPFVQPDLKGMVFVARGGTGGLADANGNALDGTGKGRNAVLKFRVQSGLTITIHDADGDVGTIAIGGGGHLDALVPVDRRRLTQFWILDPIPLRSEVSGSLESKRKAALRSQEPLLKLTRLRSNGIIVIAEIIGLDKKCFAPLLTTSTFQVNTLTFSTNATGL